MIVLRTMIVGYYSSAAGGAPERLHPGKYGIRGLKRRTVANNLAELLDDQPPASVVVNKLNRVLVP